MEPGKPDEQPSESDSVTPTGKKDVRMRLRHDSNRRILKTARPVVWEDAGAHPPVPDPIGFPRFQRHRDAVGSCASYWTCSYDAGLELQGEWQGRKTGRSRQHTQSCKPAVQPPAVISRRQGRIKF